MSSMTRVSMAAAGAAAVAQEKPAVGADGLQRRWPRVLCGWPVEEAAELIEPMDHHLAIGGSWFEVEFIDRREFPLRPQSVAALWLGPMIRDGRLVIGRLA